VVGRRWFELYYGYVQILLIILLFCTLSGRNVINFRLSPWFIVDVDPVLGCLHHVNVESAHITSEVYTASIFRVGVEWVSVFLCGYVGYWSNISMKRKGGRFW
jgi:hypothetical protein